MGSFFSPQQLTTKQTASTTALQPYADTYKQLLTRGLDVSNAAYNPATNAGVAGFAAPQTQAFQATQNMQGAYQPYLQAAGLSALTGTAPTYQTVGNYMNPYNQEVVNSLIGDYDTMINRNRQMQMSDAAKAGALTGDRRYVAQTIAQESLDAELARNLANTRQRGYETALNAAQYDSGQGLRAAQTLADLGRQAQQYGYTDVNALLGIGGLQQGQEQRERDTATQNAIRQSAYPFETAQWAANYATGLGGAAGSQSQGKTISPGPSIGQQVIGALAAAAGAAARGGAKDGGAIHEYAQGGSPFFGGLSYVPQSQMQSKGLAPTKFVEPAKANTGMNKMLENFNTAHGAIKGLGNLNNMFSTPISTTKDADSGWQTTTSQSGFMPWLKNQFSGLGNLSDYLPSFPSYNHGGVVRHGYQFGGGTDAVDYMNSPFDYLPMSYVPDNSSFNNSTAAVLGKDAVSPEAFYNSGVVPKSEMPTRIVDTAPVPPDAEPLITGSTDTNGLGGLTQNIPKNDESASLFGFKMSPEAADALMAAGFGMMASNSPFPLQAAGEGGLAALGYYSRAMKDKRERDAGKVMELGGDIVKVLPTGKVQKLYEGPKTAFQSVQKLDDGTILGITKDGTTQVIYNGLGGATDKNPQGRAQLAERYGFSPGSDAYNAYVLTGKLPKEDEGKLTVTDKKAILESDEMVQTNKAAIDSLKNAIIVSEKANQGAGASARAWLGANLPDAMVPNSISSPESSAATIDLDNIVIGTALSQLKSIFGAAPTEGERKILLDLQGSSSLPHESRVKIYKRAIELAEKRLRFNEERAAQLRGGTYYSSRPDASGPSPNTVRSSPSTSSGTSSSTMSLGPGFSGSFEN